MNQLVAVNGNAVQVPSIIGAVPTRFPVGGKIRAGIQVLTQAAERLPNVKAIYEAGVAAGKPFDEIEREINKVAPDIKKALIPKNVPYFTVRRSDFAAPEIADMIMGKFAEDRGDGVKRLYRFPVVFPADQWQQVMPHGMHCYGSSELKYWSEYSPDGTTRYCMMKEKVKVDGNGKRAIRIFGGRKSVRRPENEGLCDPEQCPEYQKRHCNLSGRFIVLIPGIPSIRPIEIATNSFYSMTAARQAFETIGFVRGGRIGGFLSGKSSFVMSKNLRDVAMIGDDGNSKRVPHWLIELEAPIDLTRLMHAEDQVERLEEATIAAAVLNGDARVVAGVEDEDDAEADNTEAIAGKGRDALQEKTSTEWREGRRAAVVNDARESQRDGLSDVVHKAQALGVEPERFLRYAKKKFGEGWSVNGGGVKRVAAHVQGFAGDADAFTSAVDGELDVFR
jgi:Recombination directionality factor-like